MHTTDGRLSFGVRVDNTELRSDTNESKRLLHGIGESAQSEGSKIEQAMTRVGAAVAGAFAVSKLKEYAMQVATVRGEFQQLEIAFETMLGSKEKSDKLMEQLVKTAMITPFNMTDVANGAKQLLAYGVAADEVNETLTRLGDISAGLSIPLGDLVMLYGTTMTQGRVFTQDLRQFMGRGIPLADELAKQMGVTKAQVQELVTAGKVGFPQVKEAIWDLTNEGSKFGGLMEKQSKSITGQISNIEDGVEQMFNSIGKKSEGLISTTLGIVSSIVDNWEKIGKAILVVISAVGAYKAALLTMNVIQKISNTLTAEAALQKKLAAMQGIALSNAEALAAAKTTLLSAAFNGLKVAIMSNPWGIVLGVLAAAATAIGLFSQDTSKAAVMTNKFGKSAAETIMNLDTLTTTLKGLTAGSETHKKVVDELNQILEEYGITQIKEGDNIDTVNRKREQAIQLIKEEAIERQRANNLSAGDEQYAQAVKDAQEEFYKGLQGAASGDMGFGIAFTTANKELQENAAAISTVIGQVVQENISLIAGKTGKEYEDGLNKMYDKIQARMRAIGISEQTIQQTWTDNGFFMETDIVGQFISKMQEASEAHDRYTDAVEKNAAAEKKAADATMDFSDKVAATQRSLTAASSDVHALYRNIKDLMSKYSENTIGFNIQFRTQVPKWMMGMKISELQRLATYFASLGDQLAKEGKTGAIVSGKYMSLQTIMQRAADYASAADQKQTKAEAAAQEAAANKKEREAEAKRKARKAAAAAREKQRKADQAKREQQQIEDQTQDRLRQIDDYKAKVAQATEQSELEIRQAGIDALEEGYEKQKKQIDLNFDRLIAENKSREKQLIDDFAKNELNKWLNANPKATKKEQNEYLAQWQGKGVDKLLSRTDLTSEQKDGLTGIKAQVQAYEDVANQIKEQATKELYQRLYEEYQDYETRRTETNKKFDADRKMIEEAPWDNSRKEAAIKELEEKRKKAIQEINDEEVSAIEKNSSLFVDLFSEAADLSDKQIQKTVKDAQQLLDYLKSTSAQDITPHFGFSAEDLKALQSSPEKIKAIQEAVKKLQDQGRKNNPFKALADDLKALFTKPKDGKKKDSTTKRLKNLAESAADCADIVGGLTSKLTEMFEAGGMDSAAETMQSVNDIANTVSNVAKGFAQGGLIGGIVAAAGEAIGYMTKAFQANARHKKALQEILKEVTAQQRAYNLALLDESLAMEKADTVFGTLDYRKAANAVLVMKEAYADLRQELEGTTAQQQKFAQGQKLFVGLFVKQYSALQQSYSGLADIYIKTGHKKTGLFGWGKGKDTFSSILDVYPGLIDAQGKFNKELAQSIIDSRSFKDNGKESLQYMIDLADKAEEAYKEVKEYLSGIFGELGNTMSDALADAFRNGTDAAEAFGDSVKTMLEKIGQQMIFSTMFGDIIQKANDDMLATMQNISLTEEQKFNEYISILDMMTSGILGQQDNYNALIEKYKQMAAAKGITLWDENEDASRSASQKGIATASQESVDELNGRMTAVQGHTFSINENTKILVSVTNAILKSVMGIERNTDSVPDRLSTIEKGVTAVKDTVNDIALKGVRIR